MSLSPGGQPVPALEGIAGSITTGGVQLALSPDGTAIYVPGATTSGLNRPKSPSVPMPTLPRAEDPAT